MLGSMQAAVQYQVLVPVLLLALLELLHCTKAQYPTDVQDIHLELAKFRANGQLFIETFPPLSYLFVHCTVAELISVEIFSELAIAATLMISFGPWRWQSASLSWAGVGIAGIARVVSRASARYNGISPLAVSNSLGEAVCLLCLAWSIERSRRPVEHLRSVVLVGSITDVLLAIAACLVMAPRQAALAFSLVYFNQIRAIVNKAADTTTSMAKICSALAFVHFRTSLCVAASICTIISLVFPLSETSSGGNYNLHHLPFKIRRDLRPAIEGVVNVRSAALHEAVWPSVPLTLYSEGAGFLWTDEAVWNRYTSSFDKDIVDPTGQADLEAIEDDMAEKQHHRVVLTDDMGKLRPVFFQYVIDEFVNRTALAIQEHIMHSQRVYLRDYNSGNFVIARKSIQALADAYSGVDQDEAEFSRTRVTAMSEATTQAEWQLLYDRNGGAGFHLYNPEAKCFLASSYRTIPYRRGSADPIQVALGLQLELACTKNPNKAASRLFAVDGVPKPALPRNVLPRRFAVAEIRLRGYAEYSLAILKAVQSLHSFRSMYAELQEVPAVLLNLHRAFEYEEPKAVVLRTFFEGTISAAVLCILGWARQIPQTAGSKNTAQSANKLNVVLLAGYLVFHVASDALSPANSGNWRFATGVAALTWSSLLAMLASAVG